MGFIERIRRKIRKWIVGDALNFRIEVWVPTSTGKRLENMLATGTIGPCLVCVNTSGERNGERLVSSDCVVDKAQFRDLWDYYNRDQWFWEDGTPYTGND